MQLDMTERGAQRDRAVQEEDKVAGVQRLQVWYSLVFVQFSG